MQQLNLNKSPKIILSRKGFDTATGGIASWIYQDRLYSIPIPEAGSGVFYDELQFDKNHSYLKVMKDLGVKCYSEAHLDPDISKHILPKRPNNWRAAFGQHGAALSHLLQSKLAVKTGDFFLFFGWFKEIELYKGRFRYVKHAPDIHQIFGWLEIGEIVPIPSTKYPDFLKVHPHIVFKDEYERGNNAIFVASEKSSWFTEANGAGLFQYHPSLTLSYTETEVYKRSLWKLPNAFFKNGKCVLSYHEAREGQRKAGLKGSKLLQSVARGQEFIAPVSKGIAQWVLSLQKHIAREKAR